MLILGARLKVALPVFALENASVCLMHAGAFFYKCKILLVNQVALTVNSKNTLLLKGEINLKCFKTHLLIMYNLLLIFVPFNKQFTHSQSCN